MPMFRSRSLLTKLTTMNVLVSGAALLLACAAFFAYDQITFRQSLVRTLSAQAEIIASNTVSALLFNDEPTAAKTLAGLSGSPNIASAGILTRERQPFARYTRDQSDEILDIPAFPDKDLEAYWFKETHVVLVRRILSEGKTIGFVYLRADLREIDDRLRRYALIAAAVLLVSLIFAVVVSSRIRKAVAQPIVGLAETARTVSRNQDYSVRVAETGGLEEVDALISSFNAMLTEIQRRDSELQKAHDELEERISDRTRELESANRELEAFSYSVSHDLRAPLDALNGFSYVLTRQYGDKLDTQGKDLVQHIRTATRRMRELIDDLLNLSRVTTGAIHVDQVDLSAIARSIADELCRSDPGRPVDFVIHGTPEAQGDARLLRIVLENLLQNSWKYTRSHSQARIEFGSEGGDRNTVYFVRDDGAGFDVQFADRLFRPFQRLHSQSEFQGSGIGLATVQRIISRHGGQIWAQAAIEKGATFFFRLGSNDGSK